ncbi:hypothetical protein FQR65_LT03205 [Abscondita terminalis]|nr:hypothetical protein FQR65_LT03205 [Abscondita terminalis]
MRLLSFVLMLLVFTQQRSCFVRIIKDFLQYNVAGAPVLHKEEEYDFDPDVGPRRARLYQEVNGIYGEKAIERLGLGIDGYDQERLNHQRIRDNGHLGKN